MNLISKLIGKLLYYVYEMISGINPQDFQYFSNYAIAIAFTTFLIKIIVFPLSYRSLKSTAEIQTLQPQLQELQKKYGKDEITFARKQQELYKQAGVSPLGGCLPLFIQLPILFAMYNVFRMPEVYAFTNPTEYEAMNKAFLWISNLNMPDKTTMLAFLASGIQLLQSQIMMNATNTKKNQKSDIQNSMQMMQYVMPIMLYFVYKDLAAGIAFYWVINILLSILQQIITNRLVLKNKENKNEA